MEYIEALAVDGNNKNIFQLLGGVRLTQQRNDTFYFATQQARDAYFDTKVIYSWADCQYVRDHRGFKVPANHENLRESSYMRFRNASYNGGWIYCFITDTEYINPNTSVIRFEVDAWITYQHLVNIQQCDVSREHISSTAAYNANTTPEGIDTGEYMLQQVYKISLDTDTYIITSAVSLIKDAGNTDDIRINASGGGVYQNVPSACAVYVVRADETDDIATILNLLSDYPWVSSNILSVTVFPKELLPSYTVTRSEMGFDIGVLSEAVPKNLTKVVTNNWQADLGGRSEKKLYTYPYCFFEMVMPDGQSTIIRPELLESASLFSLYLQGVCVPSAVVSAQVLRYGARAGVPQDPLYGAVIFGGFPSFPVQNDNYILAKSQQESQYALQRQQRYESNFVGYVMDAVNMIAGGAAGDLGMVASAGQGIAGKLLDTYHIAQTQRQTLGQMTGQISQSGGTTAGAQTLLYAYDKFSVTVRLWTVKPEYVNRITQFFNMYGYKVNEVKVPNIALRSRYNYVKCSTVNIFGDIPQRYLDEIRSMFLAGCTFWKDYDNVGVYGNNQ